MAANLLMIGFFLFVFGILYAYKVTEHPFPINLSWLSALIASVTTNVGISWALWLMTGDPVVCAVPWVGYALVGFPIIAASLLKFSKLRRRAQQRARECNREVTT